MTVGMTLLPSGRPLRWGTLVQKRLGSKTRHGVIMARPHSTQDMALVLDVLKKQRANRMLLKHGPAVEGAAGAAREKEDVEILGHLAAACLTGMCPSFSEDREGRVNGGRVPSFSEEV